MWRFLLSTKGRTSRKPYIQIVFGLACLQITAFIAQGIINAAAKEQGFDPLLFTVWVKWVLLPFCYPLFALINRRLHDIGWSGFFGLIYVLYIFVFIIVKGLNDFMPNLPAPENNSFSWLPQALSTLKSLYDFLSNLNLFIILILCLIPGTKGPNRYGPPPGQKAAPDLSVFE